MNIDKQIAIIFAGTKGHLDDIPLDKVSEFESALFDYLDANNSIELETLRTEGVMSEEVSDILDKSISQFKDGFIA
jgi:F-type H+-transporting ATPase subunit alpha